MNICFLLSKQERYYFDSEAVRENQDSEPDVRLRSSTLFQSRHERESPIKGAETLSIIGRNIPRHLDHPHRELPRLPLLLL